MGRITRLIMHHLHLAALTLNSHDEAGRTSYSRIFTDPGPVYWEVQLDFTPDMEVLYYILFERCHTNKMVNPYNGPAAKLLTPPTLTVVKMTITTWCMVLQSTSSKIAQALMSTVAQVAKFFVSNLSHMATVSCT